MSKEFPEVTCLWMVKTSLVLGKGVLCVTLCTCRITVKFSYTSSHRGGDSQLRCISSVVDIYPHLNSHSYKMPHCLNRALLLQTGGGSTGTAFLRFWASSTSISLQIHSHLNVFTSLDHFQMSSSGTEGSYSDDVA